MMFLVSVNAICPGFIMTDMLERVPDKIIEMIKERVPFNRMGTPAEVAKACVFLCSDDASFITGVVLNVDGGLTA